MKKFFAVMLLAVGIILGNFSTTEAYDEYTVDTYAYSENGRDYRVKKVMCEGVRFGAVVYGYSGNTQVDGLAFIYIYDGNKKKFFYEIRDADDNLTDSGYVDTKKRDKVIAVFRIVLDVSDKDK